mmetsp:Transcript_8144/g.18781  ORF Transcript_8144/g.18781 Transcript_8144/m.18781 type:complete len:428 (+) Transcript_8144:190-1473(+)
MRRKMDCKRSILRQKVFRLLLLWAIMSASAAISFKNVMVLAPMVRVSNLPLRLLSLEYGADLVWSEELIARKIANSVRIENKRLGTIEYFSKDAQHFRVFQTCEAERGKVILQMGVSTPEDALAAAKVVAGDVAGIDINMGCPKHFSVSGGMGAALLKAPDTACAIVKTLKENLDIPVTCKIRLLESHEETVSLMQRLEAAGADAITVHCRYISQRPREPAHWDQLKLLAAAVKVPVLGNGDVYSYEDGQRWIKMSGCAGVMVARGAGENPSCFRKDGPLPVAETLRAHCIKCIEYEEVYQNMKYLYTRMFSQVSVPGSQIFDAFSAAKSRRAIAELLHCDNLFDSLIEKRGRYGPVEMDGWGTGAVDHPEYDGEVLQAAKKRKRGEGVEECAAAEAEPANVHKCDKCGAEYPSRNKLFKHVRAANH